MYAVYYSGETCGVSGVGRYAEPWCDPYGPEWYAPLKEDERYRADQEASPSDEEFAVMSKWPANAKHGFPMHEACYEILRNKISIHPTFWKRLYEICVSLPATSGSRLIWGHKYGEDETACAAEERNTWSHPRMMGRERIGRILGANPVQEVPITETKQDPGLHMSHTMESSAKDPFRRLPWEIREDIAIRLPTRSALGLRPGTGQAEPCKSPFRGAFFMVVSPPNFDVDVGPVALLRAIVPVDCRSTS